MYDIDFLNLANIIALGLTEIIHLIIKNEKKKNVTRFISHALFIVIVLTIDVNMLLSYLLTRYSCLLIMMGILIYKLIVIFEFITVIEKIMTRNKYSLCIYKLTLKIIGDVCTVIKNRGPYLLKKMLCYYILLMRTINVKLYENTYSKEISEFIQIQMKVLFEYIYSNYGHIIIQHIMNRSVGIVNEMKNNQLELINIIEGHDSDDIMSLDGSSSESDSE